MRRPFVHEAELACEPDADDRASGAAVTEELCGSLDHEPPCPVAAHHTAVVRRDGDVAVRVLFACEPADEAQVRSRIDEALGDAYAGTDGLTSCWQLIESHVAQVGADEAEHAARLITS